ncbi:MAG TPA: hypothetical protein VM580_06705, partial [Labilithrix sp.]|nr:hypothetical protein [Labilithrix sp.]
MKNGIAWLRERWEVAVALAMLLAALLVFVKLTYFIDRPIVDDAVISIAFARSFVDGDGWRVTAHSQVVEG